MKKKMAAYTIISCIICTLFTGCGAASGLVSIGSAAAEYISGSSSASVSSSEAELSSVSAGANMNPAPVITTNNWNVIDRKTQNWFFECNYDTIELEPESAGVYPNLAESLELFSEQMHESQYSAVDSVKEDPETKNYLSPDIRFFDDYNISIIRADNDVFSFVGTAGSYYGGAHPNTMRTGVSFDTKTGRRIELTDVVRSKQELMPVVKKLLLKYYPEAAFFDLDKSMADYANKEEMQPVWYLTQDGIDIVFNPYDITPYVEGPKVIPVTFAEYPDLFTGKYKASEGSFVCSLSSFDTMNIDLDRDGKQEVIKVSGEYDGTDEMFSGVSVTIGNKSYKHDVSFLSYTAKLFHTSDGRNYLYVYTKEYNDYSTILVFDLKGNDVNYTGSIEACEMSAYSQNDNSAAGSYGDFEDSKYRYETHPITNPDGFYLQRRVDSLSTYQIRQFYTIGKDGVPETKDEFGEVMGDITLTAVKDFKGRSVDITSNELKEDVNINKGDKLTIFRSNGKDTVIFKTGNKGYIALKYDSENKIDKVPAEDLFEMLYYAG
ncbi:MAG: DUF3298 domain-containing protein [Lachnospiraceae bacterium]|nr:DUF3298 domain-containing protein [Lachnospiraceae bacterium]